MGLGVTLLIVASLTVCFPHHRFVQRAVELGFSADAGSDTFVVPGDNLHPVHGAILKGGDIPVFSARDILAIGHGWEL